jgi:hypothetical protein
MFVRPVIALAFFVLAGCQSTRIHEHAAEFAALGASVQARLKRSELAVGDTPAMVYIAFGAPTEKTLITEDGANAVWIYRRDPPQAHNEVIQNGFRRRTVYDPVQRSNTIVTEWIDPKAFPNLVPHDIRVTFRNGRLEAIERVNRR